MFEVQQLTICDGWINTWINWGDDGKPTPEKFKTFSDASMELDDFLHDMEIEYELGNIDSPYLRDEFRIVEV